MKLTVYDLLGRQSRSEKPTASSTQHTIDPSQPCRRGHSEGGYGTGDPSERSCWYARGFFPHHHLEDEGGCAVHLPEIMLFQDATYQRV